MGSVSQTWEEIVPPTDNLSCKQKLPYDFPQGKVAYFTYYSNRNQAYFHLQLWDAKISLHFPSKKQNVFFFLYSDKMPLSSPVVHPNRIPCHPPKFPLPPLQNVEFLIPSNHLPEQRGEILSPFYSEPFDSFQSLPITCIYCTPIYKIKCVIEHSAFQLFHPYT